MPTTEHDFTDQAICTVDWHSSKWEEGTSMLIAETVEGIFLQYGQDNSNRRCRQEGRQVLRVTISR